jgi:hypothetical protein
MKPLLLTCMLVLVGCSSSTPSNSNSLGLVANYPLSASDVSATEGTCPNGLACVVAVVTDAVGACALQVTNNSANAYYKNAALATFELYAPDGTQTPIPSGVYTVVSSPPQLGSTAQVAVVTFYKLDAGCLTAFQQVATSGSVTLGPSTEVELTFNVAFTNGSLSGQLTATACGGADPSGPTLCR